MKRNMYLLKPFFLFLVLLLSGCSSSRTVVNGLDEREANEIIVFLSNKGVVASKTPAADVGPGGGQKTLLYDISVPEAKATEAMAMLNMAGLPRRRSPSLLNIFSGGGLVPSQLEEKVRYQRGLAEDLANTIRKVDGVLDADVQLSFPEEDPFNPEKTIVHVSASVYVKHNGVLDDPNSHLMTKIKRLVASAIPGLTFDNVTVIGDRARFTNLPSEGRGSGDRGLVPIWSVLVAKESVGRFQSIFFFLLFLTAVLFVKLIWLFWKFFPLINHLGGVSSLFKIQPFQVSDFQGNSLQQKESSVSDLEDEALPIDESGRNLKMEEKDKGVDR